MLQIRGASVKRQAELCRVVTLHERFLLVLVATG